MGYESLEKIYYTRPQEHVEAYHSRFDSPMTRHFDFPIQELLSEEVYRKHEELLQALRAVPPLVLEQFVLSSLVDEVRATSDIEGVHSTRREIKEVVTGVTRSARFSSIVGKYQNILEDSSQMNFQTCQDVRTFYDEFAHKEVVLINPTDELDGMLFRRDSVEVTSPTGKILHRGVHPESRIIQMLGVALDVLNSTDIPLLARVAIFHYLFEYVHPFYDGNGRTARFIVSYFLAGRFNKLVALRLSVLIKKNRKKYYALFRETDSEWNCGDLTPFVLGFVEIIAATFDDIISALNLKVTQLIKYQQRIPKLAGSDALTQQIYNALLQSSVFFGGGISMARLMSVTGKSRNTLKARLADIPDGHVIKVNGVGREIFFKLNLTIFDEL